MKKLIRLNNIDELTAEEDEELARKIQYFDQTIRNYIEYRKPTSWLEARRDGLREELEALEETIENAKSGDGYGPDGRSTGVLHPSGIKGCPLRAVWGMTRSGKSRGIDVDMDLLCDVGSAMHLWHQAYLTDMYGGFFIPEVRIGSYPYAQEHGIDGHADGILTWEFDTFRTVINVEIKTTGLKKFGKITNGPLNEHKDQSTIYMKALNTPYVLFIYACRDDGRVRTMPYRFDPRRFAKLDKKIQDINKHIGTDMTKGRIDALAQPSYFECRDCQFSYECPKKGGKK
jgi:hypothetical protein